jgi:hypothetical protein
MAGRAKTLREYASIGGFGTPVAAVLTEIVETHLRELDGELRYLVFPEMVPGGGYRQVSLDMRQVRRRIAVAAEGMWLRGGTQPRCLANKNIIQHLTPASLSFEPAEIPIYQILLLSPYGVELLDLREERQESQVGTGTEPLPRTRDEALYGDYDGKAGF